jgi:hypothetical protein
MDEPELLSRADLLAMGFEPDPVAELLRHADHNGEGGEPLLDEDRLELLLWESRQDEDYLDYLEQLVEEMKQAEGEKR